MTKKLDYNDVEKLWLKRSSINNEESYTTEEENKLRNLMQTISASQSVQNHNFIQIADSDLKPEEVRASTTEKLGKGNWLIRDYYKAISISEGSLGIFNNEQRSTRMKMMLEVTFSIINKVKDQWKGIYIADGTNDLCWSFWAAANYYNIKVFNYKPTENDKRKYEKVKNLFAETNLALNNNIKQK